MTREEALADCDCPPAQCRDEKLWRAEIEKVRASTPTLTLTRKEVGKGLGWTSDKTGVYIPWDDFPKVADRLNAILAAKSQKGGDANWTDRKKQTDLSNCSTDQASTEPVKANECDTPQ